MIVIKTGSAHRSTEDETSGTEWLHWASLMTATFMVFFVVAVFG